MPFIEYKYFTVHCLLIKAHSGIKLFVIEDFLENMTQYDSACPMSVGVQ